MAKGANFKLRIAAAARTDIRAIVRWSRQEFGEQAALRYDALIACALADIRANPLRPEARQPPDLVEGVLVYHLRHSRGGTPREAGLVRRPRHFVVYRCQGNVIEVLRVLHDERDLVRHIPSEHPSRTLGTT